MPPAVDSKMKLADAVERNTNLVLRRAPVWSLGAVLVLMAMFGGMYFLKDSILAINTNSEKLQALERQVAHCHEMRVGMEHEINYLREENATLKQRVTNLEQQVQRHMP